MQPGRRFVAGLTVAALVLVIVGFGVAAFDPVFSNAGSSGTGSATPAARPSSPRPKPSVTAALSAKPSGTPGATPSSVGPTPSPAPTPSKHPVGFVVSDGTIFYVGDDGGRIPVVQVPGLQVQIQSGRAVYYALAGNKYGLKTGSYAGEFLPFVTMGQADGSSAQTGGAVLAGPVVTKLVNDAIAAISDESQRWIVALPVDIRSARGANVDVSFDDFGLAGISNTPRVVVRFPGFLPLVESVPSNVGAHILVEGVGATPWQVIDPARLQLPSNKIDPAHAMNQLLFYGDGPASLNYDVFYDGKYPMGAPLMDVSGDACVSLVVNGSHADLGPDKVLQIAGVPVFVAASS
jgi:hypothetical protein